MSGLGPASAEGPLERAVDRFNRGEERRVVAGLMKTLGAPSVSVGSAAGTPAGVRITVAWELSWYQWGVDLEDSSSPVRELDKGFELEQLDAAARQWNARALEGGVLALGAPSPRRTGSAERIGGPRI